MKQGKWLFWGAGLSGVMVASCLAAEPLKGLAACRALADGPARLACFDRESALLAPEGQPKVPPAPSRDVPNPAPIVQAPPPPVPPPAVPSVTAAPAAPLSATQQFGLSKADIAQKEVAAGARPAELNALQAQVSQLTTTRDGMLVLTLNNGQVWRQLITGEDLLLKAGDTVTISKGWLGSYTLTVPSGRACKIRRIH